MWFASLKGSSLQQRSLQDPSTTAPGRAWGPVHHVHSLPEQDEEGPVPKRDHTSSKLSSPRRSSPQLIFPALGAAGYQGRRREGPGLRKPPASRCPGRIRVAGRHWQARGVGPSKRVGFASSPIHQLGTLHLPTWAALAGAPQHEASAFGSSFKSGGPCFWVSKDLGNFLKFQCRKFPEYRRSVQLLKSSYEDYTFQVNRELQFS